jgi:hypothetical protein
VRKRPFLHPSMPAPKKHLDTECPHCGKLVSSRKIYCDNKCQAEFQNQRKLKAWLAGEIEINTVNVSKTLKNYLLEQCGHKCSKCGWCEVNPTTGKIPLEVNHIDGNSSNNTPSNMEVLCPNCHSLTPTFRNLNRGKGRKKRNLPL